MNGKIWPLTMASTVMLSVCLVLCRALGPANPRLQSFPLAAAVDAPLTPRRPPPSATDAIAALTVLPPVRADGYTAGNGFARLDAGKENVTYFMSSYFYRDVTTDDVLRNDRDKQNSFRERNEMEAEVINSNTSSKVSVTSEGKIYHPRKSAVNVNTAPPLSGTDGTANLHIHDTSTNTKSYNTQDVNEDATLINKGSQACEITGRRRGQGHLANHQLGQPQSTARAAPLMLAQASGSRYQYLPLKGDGTVHQLDPCPAPPPHTGGGSSVFAFLTFGVVTANVLMNAVANVNNNNRNNNNNENNNNNNVNNENINNNLDSNTNDNTISTGRSIHGRTTSCVCHGRKDRRRETVEETTTEPSEETSKMMRKVKNFTSNLERQERPDGPKKKIGMAASKKTLQMAAGTGKLAASARRTMACVARLVCEAHRSVRFSEGLASLGLRISGWMVGIHHASRQVLEEARVRGASGGACGPAYPCLVPHLYY